MHVFKFSGRFQITLQRAQMHVVIGKPVLLLHLKQIGVEQFLYVLGDCGLRVTELLNEILGGGNFGHSSEE